RVDETPDRPLAKRELLHELRIECISAAHHMPPATPAISQAADRSALRRGNATRVFDDIAAIIEVEKMIDLDGVKAGQVKVYLRFDEALQHLAELVVLPAGILGNAIESEPQRLEFRICQVRH